MALPAELREKARTELFETDDVRDTAVVELRNLFKQTYPALTLPRDDDAFLRRFLRARKYRMPDALKLLHNYIKFRLDHPALCQTPTRKLVTELAQARCNGVLLGRDTQGCVVVYMIVKNVHFDQIPFKEQIRAGIWIMEKIIEDPSVQVNGIVMVEDMAGMSFALMGEMRSQDPDQIGLKWMQDCFPVRFKGIHVVNQPWYLSVLMAIIRPFLSQKLADRIQLYGTDFQRLHERFMAAILPKEFGGTLPDDWDTLEPLAGFLNELPPPAE